jgi:hypothetical protein
MATKKKPKGVLEKIGDAVSAGAEAVVDAGSKAVHAVGDLMPGGKPAPKRARAKPKPEAAKATAAKSKPASAKADAKATRPAATKAKAPVAKPEATAAKAKAPAAAAKAPKKKAAAKKG